jgi:excinuclease UvrABC nuclease subunit
VQSHLARVDEYRAFAENMSALFQKTAEAAPEIKSFLEGLRQTVEQIPQEYNVQKENMRSLEHAADLTRQTMALTENHTSNNLSAYMELLKAWRAMGGAQDSLVAQCHMITRKLAQDAGYSCVGDPKAVLVAQEVRAACRQVLRNPDGYEIWADY